MASALPWDTLRTEPRSACLSVSSVLCRGNLGFGGLWILALFTSHPNSISITRCETRNKFAKFSKSLFSAFSKPHFTSTSE